MPDVKASTKSATVAKKATSKAADKPAAASVSKPAVRKAAAPKPPATEASKKSAAAPAAAKKAPAKAGGNGSKKIHLTPEERYKMICEAAYYRAEKRGFVGGNPAQDWIESEAEIDILLGK